MLRAVTRIAGARSPRRFAVQSRTFNCKKKGKNQAGEKVGCSISKATSTKSIVGGVSFYVTGMYLTLNNLNNNIERNIPKDKRLSDVEILTISTV